MTRRGGRGGSLPQKWNPEREKFHDIRQTSKISIKERLEAPHGEMDRGLFRY